MGFHQRFPLYARPLQFWACMAAIGAGLYFGLNWDWDWSLQTGNIFILITVPTELFVLTDYHGLFLGLAGAGLIGLFLVGTARPSTAEEVADMGGAGLWGPRFRFFPLTFLFGLFMTFYGVVFLFKASLAGDVTPRGYVAFLYLNYEGILSRAIISLFAAAVLLVGLACATVLAFAPGLGFRIERPVTPPPSGPASWETEVPAPQPSAASPAPTRAPSAGRTSSASPPVRSPASRARPRRTATASTRP